MITLRQVFELPSKPISLEERVLSSAWFPEIQGDIQWDLEAEQLACMQAAGLVQVCQIVHAEFDGDRFAAMHSVCFEGHPVMLVQDAGRGGRDSQRRWICNQQDYAALLAYLMAEMVQSTESADLLDLDKPVYEEELLCFYGQDFTTQFGLQCEAKKPGYQVLYNINEAILPSPSTDTDHLLAMIGAKRAPPPFIRRGGYVMHFVRDVSEEEIVLNDRLRDSTIGDNTPAKLYWYAAVTFALPLTWKSCRFDAPKTALRVV